MKLNFGPKFKYAPPKHLELKPLSERAKEVAVEQCLADMKFFTENDGRLRLDNYVMSH